MAWRMARSTRLGVVWKVFATWGYSTLVMALACLTARQRGVLRTATIQEILRSSLLLSLLVNAPMLHRACSTIIVNPNIKVKFRTNKHLKKDFSEYFELFCSRSRWDDSKCSHHQYFSTHIIWASSCIKSPSSIINCISKGEKS